jgi:hypothetical protein
MWGRDRRRPAVRAMQDPVATDDLEIEVQFLTPTEFTSHHFHTLCFATWELERRQA